MSGCLEILEPLGSVTARADGRTWRVRYNNLDGEFTDGKAQARVQGQNFDLPGSFLVENGRGLVPLSSLPALMQHFLGAPVNFRETSRRLFIGDVGVHFTAQVNKTTPPTLVMNFTSPVNPMIATEPGKLRMVFTHEPLVPPGSQSLTFDSPVIPSASFRKTMARLRFRWPGRFRLFASFSNDGRTITITPAPQAVARTGFNFRRRRYPCSSAQHGPTGATGIVGSRRSGTHSSAIFRGGGRQPRRRRARRGPERSARGERCNPGIRPTSAAGTAGSRFYTLCSCATGM